MDLTCIYNTVYVSFLKNKNKIFSSPVFSKVKCKDHCDLGQRLLHVG